METLCIEEFLNDNQLIKLSNIFEKAHSTSKGFVSESIRDIKVEELARNPEIKIVEETTKNAQ